MKHEPYLINGRPVPSVTQVTGILDKPAVTAWQIDLAVRSGDRGAGKAEAHRLADRGTRIHDQALRVAEGKPWVPGPPDDVETRCVANLALWVEQRVQKVLLCERAIYSAKWSYAGRPDLVCLLRDDPEHAVWVIDWKGSHAPRPYFEWTLQLAGYAATDDVRQLAIDVGRAGVAAIHRAIVTVNPDGDCAPHVHMLDHDADDVQAFLCLLSVYNARQRYES